MLEGLQELVSVVSRASLKLAAEASGGLLMEEVSWWHVDDVLWAWEVVSNSWMVEGSWCHTQQTGSSQVHW